MKKKFFFPLNILIVLLDFLKVKKNEMILSPTLFRLSQRILNYFTLLKYWLHGLKVKTIYIDFDFDLILIYFIFILKILIKILRGLIV